MNKADLAGRVGAAGKISHAAANAAIDSMTDGITSALHKRRSREPHRVRDVLCVAAQSAHGAKPSDREPAKDQRAQGGEVHRVGRAEESGEPEVKENRAAILPIEWDLLIEVLRGRVQLVDLPADLEVMGVQPITLFRMVEIAVRSETFPPLEAGMCLERLNPLLMANYTPLADDLVALTDEEVRYIFVEIAGGRGGHGGFLTSYAQAVANADAENLLVTRQTSLAIIQKHDLKKYLTPAMPGGERA
jgi:hypothetical protein